MFEIIHEGAQQIPRPPPNFLWIRSRGMPSSFKPPRLLPIDTKEVFHTNLDKHIGLAADLGLHVVRLKIGIIARINGASTSCFVDIALTGWVNETDTRVIGMVGDCAGIVVGLAFESLPLKFGLDTVDRVHSTILLSHDGTSPVQRDFNNEVLSTFVVNVLDILALDVGCKGDDSVFIVAGCELDCVADCGPGDYAAGDSD